MPDVNYGSIPRLAKFSADSSVTGKFRTDDAILTHIDWLLERYWAREDDWSVRRIILCDLFLTCNFWIKSYHEGQKSILKDRYPAVLGLFGAVVDKLKELLGVGQGGLSMYIEELFGRDNTASGVKTDQQMNAQYFDKKTTEAARIRFKEGAMFKYNLDSTGAKASGLSKLESSDYYTAIARGGAKAGDGFAPFVMTLERVFYMTKHTLNEPGLPNIFHSSYTGGGTLSGAGTMLIRDGVFLAIRPDSGHYRPLASNMVAVLQALGMYGVKLFDAEVYDFKGAYVSKAIDFMKDGFDWKKFEASADDLQKARGTGKYAPEPDYVRV